MLLCRPIVSPYCTCSTVKTRDAQKVGQYFSPARLMLSKCANKTTNSRCIFFYPRLYHEIYQLFLNVFLRQKIVVHPTDRISFYFTDSYKSVLFPGKKERLKKNVHSPIQLYYLHCCCILRKIK